MAADPTIVMGALIGGGLVLGAAPSAPVSATVSPVTP